MEDPEFCVKCGHFLQQGGKAMYPMFCRECADRIKKLLDKEGLLNELKRKLKVK